MIPKSTGVLTGALASLALLGGCDRQKPSVVQYDVPKAPRAEGVVETADVAPVPPKAATPSPVSGTAPTMANTAVPVAQGEATWTVPAGWKENPKPMRKGSWLAGDTDISVTAFPGSVGTLAQNIERWCGQVKRSVPGSEAEILALAKPAKLAGMDAKRVELVGESALTVVIIDKDGAQWFFKIAGTPEEVKSRNAEFDTFLASVSFPSGK